MIYVEDEPFWASPMVIKSSVYPRIVLLLLVLLCAMACSSARSDRVRGGKAVDPAGAVFVLCYHAFLDIPHDMTFPLRQLDLQLETLKNAGFNFITTEDFIAKRYRGKNNILITIDDANKSVYRAYFEVFKKYNIKPLLAISPGYITRHYTLSWEEIIELHKEGCFIAAHGYDHLYLDELSYRNNPALSANEITKSKEVLESKLNTKIEVFVYPYGERCAEAIRLLKETGYTFGFTVDWGVVDNADTRFNRFEVPRYLLLNSNVHEIFAILFDAIGKTYVPNPQLRFPPR